jgi:hypothetical protein
MKPSEISAVLTGFVAKRRPVFIWGSAGVGKSSMVKAFAKEHNLELRDVRLSQLDSIDLKGFPVPNMPKRHMEWLTPDFLPTSKDKPGILFLDECNGAMPAVASAAYQLILDLRVGNYELPEGWTIIAAGNGREDRGVTHQMPAPLNNRFVHIDYDLDPAEWHKMAAADGIHPHIRAFLSLKPQALHVFDPKDNPRSFPTPRSWYFVNDFYDKPLPNGNKLGDAATFELVQGTIGKGAGTEFTVFVRDLKDMPVIADILKDPAKTPLPKNHAVMHAVVTTLSDQISKTNFESIMTYVLRLPKEIQVVFMASSLAQPKVRPILVSSKSYATWAAENHSFIM